MQGKDISPAHPRRLRLSPRVLYIFGFLCAYFVGLTVGAPSAAALSTATLSAPGGNVSDPMVRQVDIARPAVVRIITSIDGRLAVTFTSTTPPVTFPLDGGSYPIKLSGTGAFISAHGDILTADHVANPPHDQDLDNALYTYAAQDVADYINSHFQVTQPYSAADAYSLLSSGALPSKSTYGAASSEVYLSTSYTGTLSATRIDGLPASMHATVDRIKAESSFEANDVAIIHVSGMDNMPSVQLDNSSQVAEQDNLTIIGYPGLGDLSKTPTNLLTSSINRIYVSALKTTDSGSPVIQVGGNVEHGDSGGPALDQNGRIVGIVSFGYSGINDFGETSFLHTSNSALTLIKEQGINTAPGSLETAWIQAINDYSSTADGHWQKASQELQTLAGLYPNFHGITPYLTYARQQASLEQTSAGAPNILWIILTIVLVLLVLGAVLFFVLKKNARTVVVTPGGTLAYPQQQVAQGQYPVYQQQPAGGYAPGPGSYSSSASYGQPAPGVPVYQQQAAPSSFAYAPYTSPTAYGAPAPASADQVSRSGMPSIPHTPAIEVDEVRQLSPARTDEQGDAVSVSETPERNPQAEQDGRNFHALPTWGPTREVGQEPSVPAEEGAVNENLSEVMSKSISYALPGEQAETFGARILDSAPADTPLPAMPAAPAESAWSQGIGEPAEKEPQPDGNDEKTVAAFPARSFAVPRRPSSLDNAPGEAARTPEIPAAVPWVASPCGHTNTPDVRFCRVCGRPTTPVPPE